MNEQFSRPCTAFEGSSLLCSGPLIEVALAVKNATQEAAQPILIFDDATGESMDFDLRGSKAEIIARLSQPPANAAEARGRGRPRLGVVGREVTLLPRHWEWLNAQPGGASVALRKLIEQARRGDQHRMRAAQEVAYRFMSAMAGDFPGFEEAARALFANDHMRFEQQIAGWPQDVRAYAAQLAFGHQTMAPAPVTAES